MPHGSHDSQPLTYRCVCGAVFSVSPGSTGACPKCARKYTPQALERGLAETVMLPGGMPAADVAAAAVMAAAPPEAPPPFDPLLGTNLGHFRIESCLGRGGMGAVYQALDESLQRYVALKVIRTDRSASDRSHFSRLVQEARAQARVNHPNVVQIFFVGLDESAPYLAMELIPGPTLAQRLQDGPLPFADIVRIALQLTSALERAAQYDIVHGDIKPSNILIVEKTLVKVADFGLARSLSDGEPRGVAGSPNYLSPEAARGEPLDSRSDMYSLGVTLFELTFGRLPYENPSGTIQTQLLAHIEQEPNFPTPWPLDLPAAWESVLRRLMAKNRDSRFKSYDELRQALRQVQPVPARPGAALPRMLAWGIDLACTLAGQATAVGLLYGIQSLLDLANRPILTFLATLLSSLLCLTVLLTMGWIQSAWGSPGKNLFQLKVVDLHGLPPPRRLGLLRVMLQLPIALAVVAAELLDAVALDGLTLIVFGVAGLLILVDAGFILFDRERRTVHDHLFRTRVVVDAR